MTVKRKTSRRPYRPSNASARQAPKFLPGDPIVTAAGASGRVMYATARGDVFLELSDGRKVCQHQDTLAFAPGFQPMRRR